MDALPNSFVTDTPRREPKSDAERQLLKDLQVMVTVYDFTAPDRISLSRSIIAALEAAEASVKINDKTRWDHENGLGVNT